mmetsp:Transcript_2689/g.7008  ORF Transcript_2689/g.7008 Transcript_2689/m.7008 type:complete len:266 (-) Transcript_2689:1392-2189(-)
MTASSAVDRGYIGSVLSHASGSRACATFSWRRLRKALSVERSLKYCSAHISLQLPTSAGGLAGVNEVATAFASWPSRRVASSGRASAMSRISRGSLCRSKRQGVFEAHATPPSLLQRSAPGTAAQDPSGSWCDAHSGCRGGVPLHMPASGCERMSLYRPATMTWLVTASAAWAASVACASGRVSMGQMSTPSMEGHCPSPCGVPGTGSSVGSAPARLQKVGYQSVMEKTVGLAVPRSRAGSSPPLTKLALRMPPSKLVPFCPRSG